MLIGIGLFGIVLLCIGIVIAKKALKMKEYNNLKNFKLKVFGKPSVGVCFISSGNVKKDIEKLHALRKK